MKEREKNWLATLGLSINLKKKDPERDQLLTSSHV
jgi:hypothetical protein